jgi:hypothetical protein
MIADLWQDLRFGARMLLKQPGFTAQAQSEMEIIQRQLHQRYPSDEGERGVQVLPLGENKRAGLMVCSESCSALSALFC